jgi:hypothetical protein
VADAALGIEKIGYRGNADEEKCGKNAGQAAA